jgi:hypothetical protein
MKLKLASSLAIRVLNALTLSRKVIEAATERTAARALHRGSSPQKIVAAMTLATTV